MRHSYTRTAFKADGTRFTESLEIAADDVAIQLGGYKAGNRADFLELVNRWNKAGLAATEPGSPVYVFTAN